MSSSLIQPLEDLNHFDTGLPTLAEFQLGDLDNDFPFLDFDCTQPNDLILEPFELGPVTSGSTNFDQHPQQSPFHSHTLTADANVLNQLSDLSFSYNRLEQQMSDLAARYGKLQNE